METIFVLFLWFNCIVYKSLTCHFSLTTSVYVDLKPRVVCNGKMAEKSHNKTTMMVTTGNNLRNNTKNGFIQYNCFV